MALKSGALLVVAGLVAGSCSADTFDTAPNSTDAGLVTSAAPTTIRVEESFLARQTTLTSSSIIVDDRPIRILTGTECSEVSGRIQLGLVRLNRDEAQDFSLSQHYETALSGEELRLWLPAIASPGDYQLVVACSYGDVRKVVARESLVKDNPADPEPTEPDSVVADGRRLSVVGTLEPFDAWTSVLQFYVAEPGSATGPISTTITLELGPVTRVEVAIEFPSLVPDGLYEAVFLSSNRSDANPAARFPFNLTPGAKD